MVFGFRLRNYALLVAFAIATVSMASAKGVTLIQQADGVVKTYSDVNIRVAGQTLWLQSGDRKGTLKVVTSACSFTGEIRQCLPYAVTLAQNGKTYQIAILQGSVLLNQSNAAQRIAHSSEQLAPRTVLILLHTQHGTYVTVKGRIDEGAQ